MTSSPATESFPNHVWIGRAIVASAAVCSLVSRSASANPIPETEIAEVGPGTSAIDTAKPTQMAWCSTRFTADPWPVDKFGAAVSGYDATEWTDAAERLCEHKEDPTWRKQATYLVQKWMNVNAVSQIEAEKQIADSIASLKLERSPAGQARALEQQFAFTENNLDVTKPVPGVDLAKITGKPSWCDAVGTLDDTWNASQIHSRVGSGNGIDGTIEGALHVCERPTDTTWKAEAGYIVQKWMNWTHLSQPDAERALRSRIQTAKFAAQRVELCKSLQYSPELGGSEKTYGDARLQFFGCENGDQPLWQDSSQTNATAVGFYLDADRHADELVRAYWLFAYVARPFSLELPATTARDNLPLLYYAVAQADFSHLDYSAIDKLLSAAPYNDYARTVALETLGVLKAEQKVYEAALTKMTNGDADYTAILRTAPTKAIADWDQMAERWKPELERSDAFEKLLSQPSRKVLKGCSAALTKDGQKIVKSFQLRVYKDLVEKISADPVANLLLGRLAICYAADNVWGSGAFHDLVANGRGLRGPRSFAYYAIVQAITDAQTDRPRLLLEVGNFHPNGGIISDGFRSPDHDFTFTGYAPRAWAAQATVEKQEARTSGLVASTKKVEDGLEIVFEKVTVKSPNYECHDDLRHVSRVRVDGTVEYYQNCKPLGTFSTYDETPPSIVISPLLDADVKPGVFLEFAGVSAKAKAKDGNRFAVVAYTAKSSTDPTIHSFFGFGL